MDRDSHSEDTLSTMVLENVKNKLIHAFRVTTESRGDPGESDCGDRSMSIRRSRQANEELRRAQIDGAITWLRSELVRFNYFIQYADFTLSSPESFCRNHHLLRMHNFNNCLKRVSHIMMQFCIHYFTQPCK